MWLDKWECVSGKLEPQCETGIKNSRFTVAVGSKDALKSRWVRWEIKTHSRVEVWRGGSGSSTGLRFHTPLIKLDRRFSRIQLSLQGVSHQ